MVTRWLIRCPISSGRMALETVELPPRHSQHVKRCDGFREGETLDDGFLHKDLSRPRTRPRGMVIERARFEDLLPFSGLGTFHVSMVPLQSLQKLSYIALVKCSMWLAGTNGQISHML